VTRPRILIVTIVHNPLDARIHARQITSLLEAGWEVTYAAPWSHFGMEPNPQIAAHDLPRAIGRRRLGPMRAARRLIRQHAPDHDLVLLHDPELVAAIVGLRGLPPVVWDVHEDPAAALEDRAWVPRPALPLLRGAVRQLERSAEHRHHLLLAEESYADRFRLPHPVIRNLPRVPDVASPPGPGRIVYIGRISRSRGLDTMLALPDHLPPDVRIELIGSVDPSSADDVRAAHDAGRIQWHGFLPNEDALYALDGATCGLSLLRDEPNFRGSLPSKVTDYLARGVPVITTPLREAVRLVEASNGGIIVPFDDIRATSDAVRLYHRDAQTRQATGAHGHEWARDHLDWATDAGIMDRMLRRWAGKPSGPDSRRRPVGGHSPQ
jgi:glycosyltransferase involved in cell wall biosynthesis